jgi:hypothetical protein
MCALTSKPAWSVDCKGGQLINLDVEQISANTKGSNNQNPPSPLQERGPQQIRKHFVEQKQEQEQKLQQQQQQQQEREQEQECRLTMLSCSNTATSSGALSFLSLLLFFSFFVEGSGTTT